MSKNELRTRVSDSRQPSAPGRIARIVQAAYGWACERLYHEFAWSYDGVSRAISFGEWDAWRRSALPLVRGERVLEIGFGTGVLLKQLLADGYRVAGIDASPEMVRIARARLADSPFGHPLLQACGQALPFADQSFDTVVATFPAPYILAPATLRECRRVLCRRTEARLVVVGLWVSLVRSRLRILPPVFYAQPSAQWLQRVEDTLAEQGLTARVYAQAVGRVDVGILDARRADAQ